MTITLDLSTPKKACLRLIIGGKLVPGIRARNVVDLRAQLAAKKPQVVADYYTHNQPHPAA